MTLDALVPGDIVLLGPTAAGKTALAARLAQALDGEVVCVDSRQVYRGLDLCSGKDRADYRLPEGEVPVHGMDRLDLPGEYSLFDFARDARELRAGIARRGRRAVWCGGCGLFLDALLRGYRLTEAPPDEELRASSHGEAELEILLRGSGARLHNTTDLEDRGRLLRALEVARAGGPRDAEGAARCAGAQVLGLGRPAAELRARIARRLDERLAAGMAGEVAALLERGVPAARLDRLGLEPRWILRRLRGEIDDDALRRGLAAEIWRFARGQFSWFRRLERLGVPIRWLPEGRELEAALAWAMGCGA